MARGWGLARAPPPQDEPGKAGYLSLRCFSLFSRTDTFFSHDLPLKTLQRLLHCKAVPALPSTAVPATDCELSAASSVAMANLDSPLWQDINFTVRRADDKSC